MRITVVLVTYNRLNDLKTTLGDYSKQIRVPDAIIVVNNASTDGTELFLKEWERREEPYKKIIINSNKNLGGAGGFALGIKRALDTDCDYIFIADDDAFPDIHMLEALINVVDEKNNENIAAYCTTVINNGKIDTMHRRRLIKKLGFVIKDVPVDEDEYKKELFELDYLTFVGALIKKKTIERIGLPRVDYFIREDDTEYSLRLGHCGGILCVTKSVMNHNTGTTSKLWLDYYTIRNNLINIKNNFGTSYYYYAMLVWYIKRCSFLARIIKHRTKKYRCMCKQAIKDAENNTLGFNELYNSNTIL
ncbi:MAG: glycosyltransferase [Mogibacterium sp.]|nr:glycosyltransferase [Mogibacterium sp.]